jgi:CubicO group peptidase (beta-lactamase class C family)
MNKYVDILFENEGIGANSYTRELKTKKDYKQLVSPVEAIYLSHKEMGIEYCYEQLYKESRLEQNIKTLVLDNHYIPGLSLEFGTKYHRTVIVVGEQQESIANKAAAEPMTVDSIFDLASVSKFFTCLCVLKLVENGSLQLNQNITDIDGRFIYLDGITVENLLGFQVALKTDKRITAAASKEAAMQLLYEVKPDYQETRLYSDMGAMVLKCLLEKITKKSMWELINEYILIPCNMKHTYINVPAEQRRNVVSNNFERRIVNGEYRTFEDIEKGTVSDEKSKWLNTFSQEMYGHAGIFSTADDMYLLIKEFLKGNIINMSLMSEIGKNRSGKKLADGSFRQFLAYLCYSKNPIERESEVDHFLSGNAFALGGYTGNQLTVDVNNNLYLFLASNRCHNRVTQIIPEKDRDSYFGNETNGINYVNWNDGNQYIYTKEYAYDRGPWIINPAIELAIQYSALEYLFEQDGIGIQESCRVIEL